MSKLIKRRSASRIYLVFIVVNNFPNIDDKSGSCQSIGRGNMMKVRLKHSCYGWIYKEESATYSLSVILKFMDIDDNI